MFNTCKYSTVCTATTGLRALLRWHSKITPQGRLSDRISIIFCIFLVHTSWSRTRNIHRKILHFPFRYSNLVPQYAAVGRQYHWALRAYNKFYSPEYVNRLTTTWRLLTFVTHVVMSSCAHKSTTAIYLEVRHKQVTKDPKLPWNRSNSMMD